jgi:hypothetical protein
VIGLVADKTRHIVFSRELGNVDWSNAEIMRDAARDVPKLKDEAGKKLIVYAARSSQASSSTKGWWTSTTSPCSLSRWAAANHCSRI